jgi:Tfp pilus assembly protein PilV
MIDTFLSRLPRPASDDGFMLIEVMISAMLVGLIVVATFNGFDVVNRVSADQRHHDQAAVLASQSQEQLRSDPASALDTLESIPHTYTRAVEGTTFTITQEAKPVSASGQSTGCSFNETSAQTGAYIQITSSVTWPQLAATSRLIVKQSSLITPPTGSDLEVDVNNGASIPAGVPGVTASAKFIPAESSGFDTIEGTTGSAGCVVLTGIQATNATVAIAEKPGFVTPNGTLKVPTKEVTIAPNITTHYPVTYNEAGKITAEFTYKGETTLAGKPVQSDTFVAYNVKIPAEPKFEVGAPENNFEYIEVSGEEEYKALTTIFSTLATTPHGAKFTGGDLFPFSEKWQVYAGDCPANSVESVTATTEKIANPTVVVEPGHNPTVKVPLSYVTLNVKKGSAAKPSAFETTTYPVTITDASCASAAVPNNAFAANLKHAQSTSTEGHLSSPFQPFGKYELCLAVNKKRLYRASYENTTVNGSERTIYPAELTKAEYETEEATERTTWKTKEAEGKLTKAERLAKEATQKTEKTKREAEEKEREEHGYKIEAGKEC